ncbi:hypothetical protein HID58_063616 [Brassica napus]|uniref:Uncharacterized protein n=1 Tax=Brassica napus TaxID=3708 RepID=A0ABQ8A4T4_BRANA|nr:hypothetical protein HID58_063616 [Brassica napus]
MGSSPPPVDPVLQSPDPVGSDTEAPLTNSARETEVSKSIDTDKPVQEVENVEKTETTIDKEHTEKDGNISVSDKEAGNNGVSENEEPWLMVPLSSPSGTRKLEKPETSKVPEDQSKTSPSRFHLLRKELEEGEMEDEDESASSEEESSVEIRETLEKRKQLEKEKSGISRYATVSDAASGGQWNIRRCRGYHLRAMIACINSVPAPAEDADEDRTLWRYLPSGKEILPSMPKQCRDGSKGHLDRNF